MDKYLPLCAKEANWGLSCAGMWGSTTWKIYSDGSYEITTGLIPENAPEDFSTVSGVLPEDAFSSLLDACCGRWKDPNVVSDGCDGTAWQIRMYSQIGRIVKTSGRLGYIYSQKKIENIIHLLPNSKPCFLPYKSIQTEDQTIMQGGRIYVYS